MLLIPCPHCGPREQSEFAYGGTSVPMPDLSASGDDWHRAIHLRPHPTGPQTELWYHEAGCECWIRLVRDVKTHAFIPEEET